MVLKRRHNSECKSIQLTRLAAAWESCVAVSETGEFVLTLIVELEIPEGGELGAFSVSRCLSDF